MSHSFWATRYLNKTPYAFIPFLGQVLRLGENRLRGRDSIVYLRCLPNLRTLSLRGNPLCKSDPDDSDGEEDGDNDWRGFVMALLPKLIYLECHNITAEEREAASTRHQGEIFKARNREDKAATEQDR